MAMNADIHETEGITRKGKIGTVVIIWPTGVTHSDSLIDVTRAQTRSRPGQSQEASALESEALQETLVLV